MNGKPSPSDDAREINETKPFVRPTSSTFIPPDERGAETAAPVLGEAFGRYRIQQQLGRGGMGSVWLAHDTQLDRPVALKIPKLADASGNSVERFLREARAVAALGHPNICPIFDIGQVDGTHFLAMGFIDGKPLSSYVSADKRHPERHVAQIIRKIALALHEAHGKGILHRDLKPANIMLDRRGEPIVTDFGLAVRLDREEEAKLTQEGTIIGTPAYMSPEQIDRRAAVGPRSDIYSLGVVMYELLTGRCPYSGSVVSVIGDVLHKTPRDVRELRTDVSPALAEIVARATAKQPGERYASMKEFAAALTAFLKGETAVDTQMALAPLPNTGVLSAPTSHASYEPLDHLQAPSLVLPPLPRSQPAAPPYLWWIVGGAGGVVALLVVFIFGKSLLGGGPTNVASNTAVNTPAVAVPAPPSPPPAVVPAPPAVPTTTTIPKEVVAEPEPPPVTSSTGTSPEKPTAKEPLSVPDFFPPDRPPNDDGPPGPPDEGPGRFGPNHPLARDKGLIKIEERFAEADRNHDGKLDGGELPMHIIFRADTNKDDQLTLAEVRAAILKLKDKLWAEPAPGERRPPPRPGGPGNDGPGPGPGNKGPRPPRP